jgi:hypothetical protein
MVSETTVKGVRRHLSLMLFAAVLSVLGACDGAGVWMQAGAAGNRAGSSRSAGTLRLRGGAAATLGEVTTVGTKKAFDLMLQEAGDKLVVVDFTAQCMHARPKTNAHLRRTLPGATRTQPACVLPGLLCRVWAVPADSADRGVHGDRGGPCFSSLCCPLCIMSPLHFVPS